MLSRTARASSTVIVVALAAAGLLLSGCRRTPATSARGESVAAAGVASVTITEGTNFAVAASPDRHTLVIDLLGSLWVVPGQGGAAKKITEDLIEARHPAFSPDGSRVVFQGFSDRDGWDLWSITPDGTDAKRLTSGPFDDMEPAWSHDGSRIAFSSDRSRSYEVWILDVKSGSMRRLTSNAAQDFEPAWSPNDKEIAFVRQPTAAPGAPPAGTASVMAIDVDTGTERTIAPVQGRASGPSWTPDGTQVLYSVIAAGNGRLELSGKTLASGEDVFPFSARWISGKDFLYTADGKIKKRTLGSDSVQTVAFTATVPVDPSKHQYARKKFDFDSRASRKVNGIVRPMVSPDGTKVAFAALGDLWVMEIGSRPTRITHDRFIDADPAWSPDGGQLVFSTDRAAVGNLDLWLHDMKTGRERRLTTTAHADFGANWSPDGKRIAFLSMLPHQMGAAVCVVDVQTGKVTELWRSQQRIPSYPTWSADARTLLIAAFDQYSPRFREGIWKPLLIPASGGEAQWVDVTPNESLVNGVDEGPIWSPDGTKLALVHQGVLKVMAVENGKPTSRFTQLSTDAAQSPSWTRDSRHILYLATDHLKMVGLDDKQVRDVPMDLTYQSSIPSGRMVVHAGRLWNGRDKAERADVDIVVDANRIKAVEAHRADLHTGARVIDASARTVIPGLIGMHEHEYREYGEAAGRLLLAYGMTGARDPAGMAYRCLELKEASESGARIGPRYYFSYPPLDGARGAFAEMYSIYSMDRLELELQRAKRLDYDLFKMYVKLPLAMQKRIVDFAHREVGVPVSSHYIYPNSTWGADGTEHIGGRTSALGNMYDDQRQLLLHTGIQLSPTIAVHGAYDLLALDDPALLNDERLKALSPVWAIEPSRNRVEALRRTGPAARALVLDRQGKNIVALARAGARLLAGTDAPNMPQGVGFHSELEFYVHSGLTPYEALQTATVNAAEALGYGADLGSVEPGKVADMVIISGDPLVDIKAARNVDTVIKNGNVFTMKELMSGVRSGVAPTTSDALAHQPESTAGQRRVAAPDMPLRTTAASKHD
jgi:Tol biopolymer transport system component/imidazolonepropionase-like amidohydrolase